MAEFVAQLPEIQIPGPDERTYDLFLATKDWPARSKLNTEQLLILWNSTFDSYEIVAAHNFDHATASLWLANELADVYEAADSPEGVVDRKILNGVALFHDAGKQAAFDKSDYESPEEFAAYTAGEFLPVCGYTAWEITQVQDGILSTAENGRLDTPLKKIMCRVDLYNVGDKKAIFEARTKDFLTEETSRRNGSFDRLSFMSGSIVRLGLHLAKDLHLKGLDEGWLEQARANYQGMVEDFVDEDPKSLALAFNAAGNEAGRLALRWLLPDRLQTKFENDADEA